MAQAHPGGNGQEQSAEARGTSADVFEDVDGAAVTLPVGEFAAISDGVEKRENARDAGESKDVAETISRVRGGAVCHPGTIIRLKTCPANGFERISGWPAFSA